ncbi:MAG: adenylate/guanylate cyclase domain-containing protein [Pseudomonadota bacterium]
MTDDGRAAALRDWLTGEGARIRFVEVLLASLGERLVAAGIPIDRATIHVRILHPQFMAARMVWQPGLAEAEVTRAGYAMVDAPVFVNSPVKALFDGAEGLRQRLDRDLGADAYPIYAELRAEGFTDYVGLPLVFSTGQRLATSWATRRPGGFSLDELHVLDALRPILAMATEIRVMRRLARTLAETYLGERAGSRVLEGRIRRGDVEALQAVIWFLDMRGFTPLADSLPQDVLIDRLNRFFEAFGEPVFEQGGEILKFIGDAMLAVFDTEAPADCPPLAAADDGFARLRALNADLVEEGQPPIACGLALHAGTVSYGNIGTPGRLDFTVIGPAVNEAARLQSLGRGLGEPLILSATFAAGCGRPTRSLGRHRVPGLARPLEAFVLA